MKYIAFGLAAVAAAGVASAQPKWTPLNQASKPATLPAPAAAVVTPTPAPVQTDAPAPVAAPAPPVTAAPPAITATAVANIHKGLQLWRNIDDGMTVAQVHALYPQGRDVAWHEDRTVLTNVPIMEGCSAKVNVMHPNGVVKEIVMRGDGSIAGRCSLKLITALSGKYGEPMDKDKVHGSLFGREGKNYIWAHDGVTLQLKRYTNGPLGGGGLFAASWELRYSTTDTKIDL